MKQAQFWFCFLFNKLVHKLSHIKDFFFFLITKWIAPGDNKMKTRLLTVELDLDKSGVQTVEERRASKGVFNIQPLSIYIPVTHTVILRLAAKRSNG